MTDPDASEMANPMASLCAARRFRWLARNEVLEVDVLVCPAGRWANSPASLSPDWKVWPLGPVVIALRVAV